MFSMTHISTDKTYPTNGSKEIKDFQRQWFNIEYIRRKNVQYFRPFINIKTIKNKFIFIHYSYTLLEVLGTFKVYTTTFDKTHISKFYVVKRHGGNLLEKESAKLFNLLRVAPPDKVNTFSHNEQSKEDIKNYTRHPELQIILVKYKDVFQGTGKLKKC